MTKNLRQLRRLGAVALATFAPAAAAQAAPTVQEALSVQPVQRDVQIERPTAEEMAKCSIKAEGKRGWVVRDPSGQILRVFSDTDGNNTVDQWSYYKDGIEVYRDLDTNNNKKPDQCRWLNTAGSRWGVDQNEDGKIDGWKSISPEEVTAELVAAIRDRDRARFERIMLTPAELKSLGVGTAKAQLLQKKIDVALASFAKFATEQTVVGKESKWMSFGGTQPGIVPSGTDDSTADLAVYENVMAMIDTEGKAVPLTVGAIVRVKDNWRLVDLPTLTESASEPIFFPSPRQEGGDAQLAQGGRPNEKMQEVMKKLEAIPAISPASKPEDHQLRQQYLAELAEMADTPEIKEQWIRQAVDSLSAAVQTSNYEEGITALKALFEKLKAENANDELVTYVQWRFMTADHTIKLANSTQDTFAKLQDDWVDSLKTFVEGGKKTPDTGEAMFELAVTKELGGSEEDAIKWYDSVARDFGEQPMGRKAAGAKLRLTSVGKTIPLKGKLVQNGQLLDLSRLTNKVVVVQYWATWSETCKVDMALLKELKQKYKDLEVIGVCLDSKESMLDFLKQSDPKWPQLWEEGGLESRYAVELGIPTLPTMFLLDKQGKVVNRNIRADELDTELKRILK